jgi:hypothetical protein
MRMLIDTEELHPAAEWALQTAFNPEEVDCTTAVVLKILDNKCKMLPGEKLAVKAVYDVVKTLPANLFDRTVHETIRRARHLPGAREGAAIHRLRVAAEARIPKPVMKAYKAKLRDGLFGE